jgi:hypothetical protein
MARFGRRKGMWLGLMLIALLLLALLFWLEHLGSEQPRNLKEIPVVAPEDKAGSQN